MSYHAAQLEFKCGSDFKVQTHHTQYKQHRGGVEGTDYGTYSGLITFTFSEFIILKFFGLW
jgi:hypothetical protein